MPSILNQKLRTRRWASSTLVFLLCLAAPGLPAIAFQEDAPTFRNNSPAISISEGAYDFGRVRQGALVEKTFTIRNAGGRRLDIHQVSGSGNIFQLSLSQSSIAPNQSGRLHLQFNTSDSYGKVDSQIFIHSNDPVFPEEMITVTGTVVPILGLNPAFVFAGKISQSEVYTDRVKIIGSLVEEGKIRSIRIDTSAPSIRATLVGSKTKTPLLKVTILPDLKAGTFKESVSLTSVDPPVKVELALLGYKLGDIKVHPEQFEFFADTFFKVETQTIELQCEKPFKIVKIVDLSEKLDIHVETLEKDKKYRISAKLIGPLPKGLLGLVKVYTDLETNPLLDIPVVGGFASAYDRPAGREGRNPFPRN